MAGPSVTYSFTNSTTADATQVNQNFTDLINGMTDGTKDFSINALTCAGNATFNGNVTLGNAAGDDITHTGSLASSLPVKTTFSYDMGSSTIGWKSIYFGSSDSAAKTVRVIAGVVGTSYTFTLPTGVPAAEGVVTMSSSGALAAKTQAQALALLHGLGNCTSGTKTPSATNTYMQMTNNSMTLAAGTWIIGGSSSLTSSGGSAAYTYFLLGWYAANGADSASVPTALSTIATVYGDPVLDGVPSFASTSGIDRNAQTLMITLASSQTVYLVPFATAGTAANARVVVYGWAAQVG